jgi:hypothetical protein
VKGERFKVQGSRCKDQGERGEGGDASRAFFASWVLRVIVAGPAMGGIYEVFS